MIESTNYISYCPKGGSFTNFHLETNKGIQIHIVKFIPANKASFLPVVLLPGLASVIENFKDAIIALAEKHVVYFLETREKGSSIITGKAGFTIPEIASDLPNAIELLGLKTGDYILIGYSLGASVIAAAFQNLLAKPMAVVLIEPSASFKWPWWLPPLARVAVPIYGLIKPFLKWYMKTFKINKEEDYEMYVINSRIIDQADPKKLAATVLSVRHFEAWDYLEHINSPCLVIGVSHDKFHSHDEASKIAERVPGCSYVDLLNNKRSHSAEVASLIDGFVEDIKAGLKTNR
jgi:pimeloyl-ACP methyl ester carboxylesterase